MNDDFNKKDFETNCRDCKKPIMMRYSKNKDKYYPTDLPGDYKTFHNCEKKQRTETKKESPTKYCPLVSDKESKTACFNNCAWFVPTEGICAILFLWKAK